jgi:hypothetical protein
VPSSSHHGVEYVRFAMLPLLLGTFDSAEQTIIHHKGFRHKDTKPQKLFQIFVTSCLGVFFTTDFPAFT